MRHDFSDTKHHEVFYNLVSTTRFLEYFTETTTVKLSGTTASVVSSRGFAPGTVVVRGTGARRPAYVRRGRRLLEERHAGVGRPYRRRAGPGRRGRPGQFVAPPVTRSSLEPAAHPPTKIGYPVDVPSSLRPPAPAVRYLIPAFGWQRESPGTSKTSTGSGTPSAFTSVGRGSRPGAGEYLGVVVAAPRRRHKSSRRTCSLRQRLRRGPGLRRGCRGATAAARRLHPRHTKETPCCSQSRRRRALGSASPGTRSHGTRSAGSGSPTSSYRPAPRISLSSSSRLSGTSRTR